MANTYIPIASTILSSPQTTITFSSIPSTYTDLLLKASIRTDTTAATFSDLKLRLNGNTSSVYNYIAFHGNGTTMSRNQSSNETRAFLRYTGTGNLATSNNFGSCEIYIPSYNSTTTKNLASTGVMETNNATAYMAGHAMWFNDTTPITQITLQDEAAADFMSGSSFYLYGIKNS